MLVYSQSTGRLTDFDSGKLIGIGYSGKAAGKNNPDAENQKAIGPIPRGYWRIGKAYDSAKVGPRAIPLHKLDSSPSDDLDSDTGRSAFRIHGDSASAPGMASQGCIILPRIIRETIIASNHEILKVTS